MQTIGIGKKLNKYTNKLINVSLIKKEKKKVFFSENIMEEIKQSEKEFANGQGIPAEEVFKELREKYGF